MTTEIAELASKIANLKTGYMHGTNLKGKVGGAYVRPKNEGFECEVVWTVPEAYGDNPTSFAPRGDIRVGACYVGRKLLCATAEEAAQVYVEMKAGLLERKGYSRGEKIGNVTR